AHPNRVISGKHVENGDLLETCQRAPLLNEAEAAVVGSGESPACLQLLSGSILRLKAVLRWIPGCLLFTHIQEVHHGTATQANGRRSAAAGTEPEHGKQLPAVLSEVRRFLHAFPGGIGRSRDSPLLAASDSSRRTLP